jgi:hypothetical protein
MHITGMNPRQDKKKKCMMRTQTGAMLKDKSNETAISR